jgi:hypothetical protein
MKLKRKSYGRTSWEAVSKASRGFSTGVEDPADSSHEDALQRHLAPGSVAEVA